MDMTTSYLGMSLKNPLVASASPLNGKLDNIRLLEDAGAAAVVLPSIFEEQIAREQELFDALMTTGPLANIASLLNPYRALGGILDPLARPDLKVPELSAWRPVFSRPGWRRSTRPAITATWRKVRFIRLESESQLSRSSPSMSWSNRPSRRMIPSWISLGRSPWHHSDSP